MKTCAKCGDFYTPECNEGRVDNVVCPVHGVNHYDVDDATAHPAPGLCQQCAAAAGIVETCGCGRRFTAAQWAALPLVRHGFQDVPFDQTECRPPCTAQYAVGEANHAPDCESRGYTLEIRNCFCKSTLARKREKGWRP